MGAESGSQRILDAMEKGTRVEQIPVATRLLHDAGIEVGFFLQFGYPGERWEDIALTLQMVRECRPDDIGISVSYPLPRTPFHERVKAQLGDKQNWVDSSDMMPMFQATYVPEFYRALHALAHAEFRARKPGVKRAVAILKLPVLKWRVDRLARLSPRRTPVIDPADSHAPGRGGTERAASLRRREEGPWRQ